MIPPVVGPETKSDAERNVFALLGATEAGNGAVAYHSLNLSKHDYKRAAEADFVLLTKRGVFVLEVKGGEVERKDGIWTYTNRYGDEHRNSEGPFKQAQSAMFALEKRLSAGVERWPAQTVFGYGVIIPDRVLKTDTVEWDPEIVLDAVGLEGQTELSAWIEQLADYWHAKTPKRLATLKAAAMEALRAPIRPDFDRGRSLRVRAGQIDTALEAFTDDQYFALDILVDSPRVLFKGGAGTGKSFVAAEAARRDAANGASVAYVCPHRIFAAFMRSRLDHLGIAVGTIEQIGSEVFDILIVDEAQDFMNVTDLVRLDALVNGGLAAGGWRMFLDPNRQRDLIGSFDPDALLELESYKSAPAALSRNCRNTQPIAKQTRLYTGADLGNPMAGDGPRVAFHYCVDGAETDTLATVLTELRAEEVPEGWITVVGPASFASSSAADLRSTTLLPISEDVAYGWPGKQITYSSIAEFKGLENSVVIVTDLHLLDQADEISLNHLYVGMSRARASLHIIARPMVKAWLRRLGAERMGIAP